MKFLIAIEAGTDRTAWGVVVPDLPGCFSAGDTLEAALCSARQAIEAFCTVLADEGGELPRARPAAEHQAAIDLQGWTWTTVEVPVEHLFGLAKKR